MKMHFKMFHCTLWRDKRKSTAQIETEKLESAEISAQYVHQSLVQMLFIISVLIFDAGFDCALLTLLETRVDTLKGTLSTPTQNLPKGKGTQL